MCNLTALPPDRPASKRHQSGTAAVLKRARTAKSALPQRSKLSEIRYLSGPNCGIFSAAGTEWPRRPSFFDIKSPQTWAAHQENIRICATWLMHNFSCPKLYVGLPFSPPGPAWPPFSVPQCNLGTRGIKSPLPPFAKGGVKSPPLKKGIRGIWG